MGRKYTQNDAKNDVNFLFWINKQRFEEFAFIAVLNVHWSIASTETLFENRVLWIKCVILQFPKQKQMELESNIVVFA